jgi:hypothetical protein
MSTLKVNDIQEATSGGGKIFPPRMRATVNQSGTQAILGSDNLSSITDSGTGRTTFSFSTNFANANYTVAGCQVNTAGGYFQGNIEATSSTAAPTTMSTSAVRIGMGADTSRMCVTLTGDQ